MALREKDPEKYYQERMRKNASKGGKTTVEKYGKGHMKKIAKKGGRPKKETSDTK